MSVNRNLAASFVGNTWAALIQVAFVPVYIHLLGVEAFGLIGFYAALQVSLWILDLGFTPAVSREVSRVSAGAGSVEAVRDLLRSIEWVFLPGAVVLAALAFALAPWIAAHWLNAQSLSNDVVVHAIALMGLLSSFRLYLGLHRGVINGAQRLMWLSGVGAAAATLRGAGVIPVLWANPSIEAFFAFQLVATVFEVAITARKAWRLLPSEHPARPSRESLRGVQRFSGAMMAVAALYAVLTQCDKLLLSALLPLGTFGQYALAASVAGALNLVVAPVAAVAYPRLNLLHARGEPLAAEIHAFSRIVALAVAPAAAVLALFAQPLLEMWTREPAISAATAPLLTWLALASMLHAFTTVPYLLPLVRGNPARVVATYAALVGMVVPAVAIGVAVSGPIGAAQAWFGMNLLGVAICWPVMAAALPAFERQRWVTRDVLVPAGAALAVVWVVRDLAGEALPAAVAIIVAYGLALGAVALCVPAGRRFLARMLGRGGVGQP